ncbi:hypothetical protein HJD18_01715 [Thermoleophilia bacterium SCSIO 60948]|nr:hypothetical protein HJD18_01715 [Thermoleophilia bacterium SCSIO 60948]
MRRGRTDQVDRGRRFRAYLLGALATAWVALPAEATTRGPQPGDGIDLGIAFTTEGLGSAELASTIETLRVGVSWGAVQRSCRAIHRGRFDWRRSDRTMRRALAAQRPILLTLAGAPRCAAAIERGHAHQPKRRYTGEFATFAARVAERYGPGGTLTTELGSCCGATRLEVWNEPNIRNHWAHPSPGSYARLFGAVSERVRRSAVGEGVELVTGGLAASSATSYARRLLSIRSVRRRADAIGLHTYTPSPEQSLGLIAAIRRRMNAAGRGATPIVVSEHAWSTCPRPAPGRYRGKCTSAPNQATMLREYVDGLRLRPELGVDSFLWYTPQDLGRESNAGRCPSSPKFFYGLFDLAGDPKPAWWVWQGLVRKLGPSRMEPVERHRQRGCG